jgi:hypothetical protein
MQQRTCKNNFKKKNLNNNPKVQIKTQIDKREILASVTSPPNIDNEMTMVCVVES